MMVAWPVKLTWEANVLPSPRHRCLLQHHHPTTTPAHQPNRRMVSETLRLPLRAVVASSSAIRSSRSAQQFLAKLPKAKRVEVRWGFSHEIGDLTHFLTPRRPGSNAGRASPLALIMRQTLDLLIPSCRET